MRALTRLPGQPAVRAQVVEALVRYGSGVVDLLIGQLPAEGLNTRQAAAVALGRIGASRATPALVDALAEPGLAVPAAAALARIGDGAAFEPLLALVGDPNPAIRQATIAALNSIGHPEMPKRVVELLQDARPLVRESAVRIAGYFGYAECTESAIERCSDESEPVRRAAVEQLPMFEDPRAIAVLAGALRTDTGPVRAAAAAAFARVEPDRGLEPLTQALGDTDPWVRYFALRSLGRFRIRAWRRPSRSARTRSGGSRSPCRHRRARPAPAPDIVSVLEPLSRSAEPDTARAAIRALGHVRDGRAQPRSRPWRGRRNRGDASKPWTRSGTRRPDAISILEWAAAADEEDSVALAVAALAAIAPVTMRTATERAALVASHRRAVETRAVDRRARAPARAPIVRHRRRPAQPLARRALRDGRGPQPHAAYRGDQLDRNRPGRRRADGSRERRRRAPAPRQPDRHPEARHARSQRSRCRSPPGGTDGGRRRPGVMSFNVESLGLAGSVTTILRDLVHERLGLSYEPSQFDQMADRLAPLVVARGLSSFMDYYYLLKYSEDAGEWGRVMDALAVQETYFWREIDQIRAIVEHVIPALAKRRDGQPIKIWSVPCATGEEPLTIAMMLNEHGWLDRVPIEIAGSDASPAAVAKAREGRYGRRAFRNLPEALRDKYFTASGERWTVDPGLHARVSYDVVNLVDAAAVSRHAAVPVIFCRNVFIYFSDQSIRRAVETFAQSMPESAYVCVGASESLLRLATRFELREIGGAFVYVKPEAPSTDSPLAGALRGERV